MTTYKTGKADYNATCDVCGWKFKASQLIKRWDGFMVCKEDYESRNILDFYKTRQDVFPLPFTRPDDAGELVWVPTNTGTITGTGTTVNATYIVDSNNVVSYKIQLTPTGNLPTTGTTYTFSLPVGTVSVDKKGTARISTGKYLGQVTATTKINVPDFTVQVSPLETLLIAGQYTKA